MVNFTYFPEFALKSLNHSKNKKQRSKKEMQSILGTHINRACLLPPTLCPVVLVLT